VRLTLSDVRALPLAACLVDGGDEPVAATPEWPGLGAACIEFCVRGRRLIVATRPPDATAAALADELLAVLTATAAACRGAQRSRVRMLAASCRLLCGRDMRATGSSREALQLAGDGIAARATLAVETVDHTAAAVSEPDVIALVLVQLAVNAAVHGGARSVVLEHTPPVFTVSWTGAAPAPPRSPEAGVITSRRHADRRRWGLGFARLAADALGGTVYPPRAGTDGRVESTFELGLGRLALPLAAVRDGRIERATAAWEEETGLLPGDLTLAKERLDALAGAAAGAAGGIASLDGWAARAADGVTWVAIPPDDAADRLRDVLDGLVHERALADGLPVATQATLRALALSLGARLGRDVPRMPAAAWRRRMLAVVPRLAPEIDVPAFEGVGALDADVTAVLAARAGGRFEVDGDTMWLYLKRRDDPVVGTFADADDERVRVS